LERGLAYESFEPINWCPSCKTGLANEDVEDGKCERCGTIVEKKPMRQWVLKITDYADRLLTDLDKLDWPESIKESQKNWIGRSEGALLDFKIKGSSENVQVFTTRPDTLFGVTYVVLAPEHELVSKLSFANKNEVKKYVEEAKKKNEIERTDAKKDKTGVELKGVKAINSANGTEVPVFVADYVLVNYGTGAVMAVPAHDTRDFDFAQKYELPIKTVIEPFSKTNITSAFEGDGILIDSGKFSGLKSEEAKRKITEFVGGSWVVRYKLKDWVFSRQRYWGEPFPVLHDGKNIVPVDISELPVELPKVKSYEPTGTGESPLAAIEKWVNVKVGKGKDAKILKRETNTMPQWAGSSWYYLRYMDPKNNKALVDIEKEKYWNEVDFYVGGAEHATRHLIYARFWHKFLYDIGVVSTLEPFKKLQSVGLIMGEDGRKMSKRFGNIVNPDDIVSTYGADTLRLYEMFMGPFDQAIAWSTNGMISSRRFIERVWRLSEKVSKNGGQISGDTEILLNKTIKKVTEDITSIRHNTAVSNLMILSNTLEKEPVLSKSVFETFLKLLAPFAPHVTEELWKSLGNKKSIHVSDWPVADESKIVDKSVTIIVQINGKMRASFVSSRGETRENLEKIAFSLPDVKKWIGDNVVRKIIVVQDRLISIVI
jgi:leucyl-tRNA synthetase